MINDCSRGLSKAYFSNTLSVSTCQNLMNSFNSSFTGEDKSIVIVRLGDNGCNKYIYENVSCDKPEVSWKVDSD